jgi:glycosyltransferase involved in cell wall biosynthesis
MVSRAEARDKLGLARDAFVVSALARLSREKGIADLIEGVARVPESNVPVHLVIAGEGGARAELEALAASRLNGRVLFTGQVPEASDIYAAADLFALPSHMEGFGLVYLEAALHGVPSVGTSVGGIPFAIKEGVTGLLVPLRDVDAIGRAIGTMRDDPERRKRMGQAARERVEREFSPSAMCDNYARVLFP